MGRRQLMMIAMDAMDIDYIESVADALPHTLRCLREGVASRLDSPAALLSAAVWPTFYTGTPPGEHGYYYPLQWDAERMRLRRVNEHWLRCEPFWHEPARQGLQVTALDVQLQQPSRIARGTELINWGSQSATTRHSNPPELAREVLRRFGRHPMGKDIPVRRTRARLVDLARKLPPGAQLRGQLVRWLLSETDWDFFIAAFPECHRAGHYLWPDPHDPGSLPTDEQLLQVYRAVDHELGVLLDAVDLDRTTVILFSLHGMGLNGAQNHFLPEVLDRINSEFHSEGAGSARSGLRQRSPMRGLRDQVPARVQEWITKWTSDSVRDWVVSRAFGGGLDWSRTPGFALPTGGEGLIRLNLAGREIRGMLEPGSDDSRRYVATLREGLESLRVADSDAPVVAEIASAGERFPGPRSDRLPDLMLRWTHRAPAREIVSPLLGRFEAQLATGRGGNHRPIGFAAVLGAGQDEFRARPPQDLIGLADAARELLGISVGGSGS